MTEKTVNTNTAPAQAGAYLVHQARRRARYALVFFVLIAAFCLITVLNINIGNIPIPLKRIVEILFTKTGNPTEVNIIWKIRLPRILMAAILGGALSLAGFLLQTFFENPIAGPFVLGISSGAKMVVAFAMIYFIQIFGVVSSYTLILAAFVGSLLSVGFILLFSRRIPSMSTLLVAGIMIGYICTAITDFTVTFAADSDIVILTSGIARKPGQTRLELAQTNVNITKQIIPEITKYAPLATYIIVSNPVDILTYTFCKLSGIPESRIIGSGTILDTARLRARLSEYYNINQSNVHAYVFGEHGDSSFIPWSVANISNVPISECQKLIKVPGIDTPPLNFAEIEQYVRKSGGRVIQRKGATFYAVSVSVCHICKCILAGIDTTMTVSTMMHGEYGIENVCLSTLNLAGHNGVRGKVNIPLTDDEVMKLRHSADTLKEVIGSLNI